MKIERLNVLQFCSYPPGMDATIISTIPRDLQQKPDIMLLAVLPNICLVNEDVHI